MDILIIAKFMIFPGVIKEILLYSMFGFCKLKKEEIGSFLLYFKYFEILGVESWFVNKELILP